MKKQQLNESDVEALFQYGLRGMDLKRAERRIYECSEFVSRAGESLDSIYFVISGKAKVFISLYSGKQLLLAWFTSKGIIGDMELIMGRPGNYTTVQAVTEFTCIALPLSVYAEELKNNNAFINYVAGELAKKLAQRAINDAITTLQPLEARLCAYITQTASDGLFCDTLTEVAGVVGASYRHLLRCLGMLCDKNILRKEPSGYRIINQKTLDDSAGDLYVLK